MFAALYRPHDGRGPRDGRDDRCQVGLGCLALLDDTMVDLPCTRLELDELWSFVGKKQKLKTDEGEPAGSGRYSPPRVTGIEKLPIYGEPVEELVSTSCAERVNLSVPMMGRRYTRLTNAFGKKLEQHIASTALTIAAYNFVRTHKTLRCTPAMAAGVSKTLWSTDDLVAAALDGARP